jgi:hypothetical protein
VPAGRWATPTADAGTQSSPGPDGAAASPAVPPELQTAASEAYATAQSAQQLTAVAAPAAAPADLCKARETPIEVQADVVVGVQPSSLPRPQSPPQTAERWQLGGAAELQPASPVVTPAQHALWAQGSPEVFSTPTAELQPPSPGCEDPESHDGGNPAKDSLQPVPFGLDSPLAAHTDGIRGDSALSPAAASPDAAGADMLAAQECTQKVIPRDMLRISPLPDCRSGVSQRVRESAKPMVAPMACRLSLTSLCNNRSAIEALLQVAPHLLASPAMTDAKLPVCAGAHAGAHRSSQGHDAGHGRDQHTTCCR